MFFVLIGVYWNPWKTKTVVGKANKSTRNVGIGCAHPRSSPKKIHALIPWSSVLHPMWMRISTRVWSTQIMVSSNPEPCHKCKQQQQLDLSNCWMPSARPNQIIFNIKLLFWKFQAPVVVSSLFLDSPYRCIICRYPIIESCAPTTWSNGYCFHSWCS